MNKSPIFIVGIARGGSSILLNILRSHPDVCSPRGETQEVFKGKSNEPVCTRLSKLLHYLPILILQQEDIVSIRKLAPRKPLKSLSKKKIDQILYHDKLKALHETQNYYKSDGIIYTQQEIRRSRLLCKNLNGLAFLTDMFIQMYPDAIFFGLVRNGLSICESHLRRGSSVNKVRRLYEKVSQKMISDSNKYNNYHLIKYEDLIFDTIKMVNKIYFLAGLDSNKVKKLRLTVRKGQGQEGHTGGEAEELVWYSKEQFEKVISPNFNQKQINSLSDYVKKEFLKLTKESMEYFDYI